VPICRILLVDDSSEFLESAARFLSAEPWIEIVGCTLSGRDAVEQVALLQPDLVLMDLAMPDMTGLTATHHIKSQPGAPCVVILTLHDNLEYRVAAEAAHADGFITKSEFATQLLPLLHTLFDAPLSNEMGLRALAVDGNPDECAALVEYLRRDGYEAVGVDSVDQARQVLANQPLDLLLLGSILPDGSRLQLCNEIRERLGPEMVIILVNGDSTPYNGRVGLELGADDFVLTPFDAEELLARIEAKLRRRRTLTKAKE
jgi:DNA-binding response OmpR family regulator